MGLKRWGAVLLALAMTGCGAESENAPVVVPDAGDPDAKPTVALLEPKADAVVRGAVSVKVEAGDDKGLEKLELFLDDAQTPVAGSMVAGDPSPYVLVWDTGDRPAGFVSLVVRATDSAGQTTDSAPVRVYVFDRGEEVKYRDGHTGTLAIPADYDPATGGELDVKHHWINPTGVTRISAVAMWKNPAGQAPWKVELAVGSGECPDSGQVLQAMEVSSLDTVATMTVSVDVDKQKSGLHFVHLAPVDAAEHKGQALPYSVYVFLEK